MKWLGAAYLAWFGDPPAVVGARHASALGGGSPRAAPGTGHHHHARAHLPQPARLPRHRAHARQQHRQPARGHRSLVVAAGAGLADRVVHHARVRRERLRDRFSAPTWQALDTLIGLRAHTGRGAAAPLTRDRRRVVPESGSWRSRSSRSPLPGAGLPAPHRAGGYAARPAAATTEAALLRERADDLEAALAQDQEAAPAGTGCATRWGGWEAQVSGSSGSGRSSSGRSTRHCGGSRAARASCRGRRPIWSAAALDRARSVGEVQLRRVPELAGMPCALRLR